MRTRARIVFAPLLIFFASVPARAADPGQLGCVTNALGSTALESLRDSAKQLAGGPAEKDTAPTPEQMMSLIRAARSCGSRYHWSDLATIDAAELAQLDIALPVVDAQVRSHGLSPARVKAAALSLSSTDRDLLLSGQENALPRLLQALRAQGVVTRGKQQPVGAAIIFAGLILARERARVQFANE